MVHEKLFSYDVGCRHMDGLKRLGEDYLTQSLSKEHIKRNVLVFIDGLVLRKEITDSNCTGLKTKLKNRSAMRIKGTQSACADEHYS